MIVGRQSLKIRCREPLSGGLQGKHPLDNPAQRHQIPLTLDIGETSREELTEPHRRFDDTKHRFRLAQRVELSTLGILQPVRRVAEAGGDLGATAKRSRQLT